MHMPRNHLDPESRNRSSVQCEKYSIQLLQPSARKFKHRLDIYMNTSVPYISGQGGTIFSPHLRSPFTFAYVLFLPSPLLFALEKATPYSRFSIHGRGLITPLPRIVRIFFCSSECTFLVSRRMKIDCPIEMAEAVFYSIELFFFDAAQPPKRNIS